MNVGLIILKGEFLFLAYRISRPGYELRLRRLDRLESPDCFVCYFPVLRKNFGEVIFEMIVGQFSVNMSDELLGKKDVIHQCTGRGGLKHISEVDLCEVFCILGARCLTRLLAKFLSRLSGSENPLYRTSGTMGKAYKKQKTTPVKNILVPEIRVN